MKPAMSTILGLSLITAGSAALLYMYWRKKDKDKDEVDTPDGTIKLPTEIRKSFEVPNSQIPLIVGRNGATLNSIEMKTNTRIHFQEKNNSMHVCEIIGKAENVKQAEILILKEAQRPTIITEEITVPQNACGKIVGRCGDTLSEICRKSLAKVWIEPGTSRTPTSPLALKPGEEIKRRVLITGTEGQVKIAKSLIEEKVKEDALMREQLDNLEKREPRVRTPPSSAAGMSSITEVQVREVMPPKQEKLAATGSDGQLEVFVSACETPSRFWLQLVGPQSTELDILVETMTEYYNQADNQDLHRIREPYLGQIVAAMFNLDNKWYRAEIVAIQPNDFNPAEIVLDLYFVDYGDSQFARPHEVLELRADFLGLRFQAIEVFLANVVPANDSDTTKWDASTITRFDELTHVATWKKLISKIVTYRERASTDSHSRRGGSPVPGVELYDSQDGKDINIAKQLVLEGHARMFAFGDLMKSHVLLVEDDKSNGNIIAPKTSTNLVKNLTDDNIQPPLSNGNHSPTTPAKATVNFLDTERSTPTSSRKKNGHPLNHILNQSNNKKSYNNNNNNNHSSSSASSSVSSSSGNLNGTSLKDTLNNDFMSTNWNDIVEEDQMNKSITSASTPQ